MIAKNQEVPVFKEIQYFRQSWIMLIVSGISVWFWYIFYHQVIGGVPFGQHPMPTPLLIVFWVILGWCLPILFYVMKLITEVRSDGIYIRFYPFFRTFKKFQWEEIQSYHIRNYRPLREYGGWGIRKGLGGSAYNVKGKIGLQMELVFPRKLLIGTQNPNGFLSAVQQYIPEKQRIIQE